MAFIGLCSLPLILIVMALVMPTVMKRAAQKFKHTASSMTIAEEALSAIRTVKASNRESRDFDRFNEQTELAAKAERGMGGYMVVMIVTLLMSMWIFTVVNMYYGATLVEKGEVETGRYSACSAT
jgi:ATP-binding cassette subfamily B (MDR/TAP) protein 8